MDVLTPMSTRIPCCFAAKNKTLHKYFAAETNPDSWTHHLEDVSDFKVLALLLNSCVFLPRIVETTRHKLDTNKRIILTPMKSHLAIGNREAKKVIVNISGAQISKYCDNDSRP